MNAAAKKLRNSPSLAKWTNQVCGGMFILYIAYRSIYFDGIFILVGWHVVTDFGLESALNRLGDRLDSRE